MATTAWTPGGHKWMTVKVDPAAAAPSRASRLVAMVERATEGGVNVKLAFHGPLPTVDDVVDQDEPEGPTMFQEVARMVRLRAEALDGVHGAFVRKDGLDFTLTGPEWTPELSRAAAELSVTISKEMIARGHEWVSGGYMDVPDDLDRLDDEHIRVFVRL